jgi:hypothetical protein
MTTGNCSRRLALWLIEQIVVSDGEAILGIGDQVGPIFTVRRYESAYIDSAGIRGNRHLVGKSGDLHPCSWHRVSRHGSSRVASVSPRVVETRGPTRKLGREAVLRVSVPQRRLPWCST